MSKTKPNTKNILSFIKYRKPRSTLGVLQAARWILSQPGVWIKKDFFRHDENGRTVQCCIVGAVDAVDPDGRTDAERVLDEVCESPTTNWNDEKGRRLVHVLALLDKAIKRVKVRGP